MKFAMNLCLHTRKKFNFNNNSAIGLIIEYFELCLEFKYWIWIGNWNIISDSVSKKQIEVNASIGA